MGTHHYGLRQWVADDFAQTRCHLGSRGSTDEIGAFYPISMKYSFPQLSTLFEREIIRLHRVPVSIVSTRDSRLTSQFWQAMQEQYGTKLQFNTAFHPQTDGQSERLIQILEDMLRACVLQFGGSREEFLPLCEFAYNNSYQASIGMPPFEALYGRPCRSPACWVEPEDVAASWT
ncbi:hypothetical protein Scep_023922 [Stephania cephalantha]|uniref:Integrase catalytic domain-containing protein n=1 Tax=Stephania cephalantha TaxID=152367 RepID=A0AAP0EYH0_9MAGN